jgi:two-component system, NarL family, response regulator LiaR
MLTNLDTKTLHKTQTKVMIVDDQPLLRQALTYVLKKCDEFSIVGEAADGEEAVQLALEHKPDIIIMDIAMPRMNGWEATRRIKEQLPSVAILVLTIYDDPEDIIGILEAGAAGYLMKDVFGDAVVSAIKSIVNGERVLSDSIIKHLLKYTRKHPIKPKQFDSHEKLTMREIEILKLLASGISNKDIANVLGLEVSTVRSHLAIIFSKLRVGSRTEAVTFGIRSGLLTDEDL